MLISKDEAEKKLTGHITRHGYKDKELQEVCIKAYKKYNLPIGLTSDLLTLRLPISGERENVIYILCDVLGKQTFMKWFTEDEKEYFSKWKYQKISRTNFEFDAVQIRSDQWIGKITLKELIELRDAQQIKYNENTQRTMKRKVYQGSEYYQIALNKVAVSKIKELMIRDSYIPDELTFNVPLQSVCKYNPKEHKLVIENLGTLDIIDGYHRYIALCQLYEELDNFDYTMEVRIVQFDEYHAKQFIYQKDQKTKMKRIDSESYNQEAVENIIVNMINRNPSCLLHGKITTNNYIISSTFLAALIKNEFLKGVPVTEQRKLLATLPQRIIDGLNEAISNKSELIEKRWTNERTAIAIHLINQSNISKLEKYLTSYCSLISNQKQVRIPSIAFYNRLRTLDRREGENNV